MMKINYEQAIKKPSTDIAKLIIGIVLSIVPIIHWLAKGFILECSGVGKTKPSKKMPEFKNWGYLFIRGLVSDIILLIYAIPALLVFLVGLGSTIGTLGSLAGGIVTSTGMTSDELSQLFSQSWYLGLPVLFKLAPIMVFGFVLLLIAFYLTPIAVLNYLKTKKFSEAFSLNKVTKKAFTGDYLVVWLIAMILTGVITFVLLIIPLVGPQIAFFIAGVISYSLYGQIYRKVR
jgi:hypothetical protein